jgi:hypothetical protein
MPADTKHSVVAHTALVMALYLLPRDVAPTARATANVLSPDPPNAWLDSAVGTRKQVPF